VPYGLTIREATEDDLAAIEQLVRAQPGARCERAGPIALGRSPGRRHLLVLDAPRGGLAAAALLEIDGARGHLAMLAVAQQFEDCGLEDRLIGVAEALCRAFGVHAIDVPASRAA
jgi:N-acetylglutamate synthase-like GNAT family acetyltransferase